MQHCAAVATAAPVQHDAEVATAAPVQHGAAVAIETTKITSCSKVKKNKISKELLNNASEIYVTVTNVTTTLVNQSH